jgi:hypothetical protein
MDNFFSSDFLMTCAPEVSTAVGLSDKIIKEYNAKIGMG